MNFNIPNFVFPLRLKRVIRARTAILREQLGYNKPVNETYFREMSFWIILMHLVISSWMRCSMLILPNPKSLKWRNEKRRISFHSGPFENMTPRTVLFSS